MFRILQCLFVFALFAKIQAQVNLAGCPDVQVVNDFDASRYTGRWYESERYPTIFEEGAKCVTATYTAQSDGSIGVFNEQINSETGAYKSINGSATLDGPSNIGKLSVEFPSISSPKGSYWVLGTDYDNFSVVWSCNSIGNLHIAFSWILTRQAAPSQETLNEAYAVIEQNSVPIQYYAKTVQDCTRRY